MSRAQLTGERPPVELPTERSCPFDPAPELGALREDAPLSRLAYPDGHVGWLVTSHALAHAVLTDPRFSIRSPRFPLGDAAVRRAQRYVFWEAPEQEGDMLVHDPPEHTKLRRLHAPYFTAHYVREQRQLVERIVADQLDAMEAAGSPTDLLPVFAVPVPSMVICELLGVPHEDRVKFEQTTERLVDPDASPESILAAMEAQHAYARGVVERKLARPGDDLLSELLAAGDWSEDEMVGATAQLFRAGHHTSAMMIALSVLILLSERERWEALRADPSLVDGAVEELLRHQTVFQNAEVRSALEDVELEGTVIAAGDSVLVSLGAANRDPEKYEDPDQVDLHRDASRHLAFGHGRHVCLGQHVARLELQVALAGLLQRFPTLRLAVPAEEVPMHPDESAIYGVRALPVAW